MPPPPRTYAEGEFSIYIETNQVIPAALVAALVKEVDRIARLRRNLGGEAVIEVVEISTGSLLARFRAVLPEAAMVAAVMALPFTIAQVMQTPGTTINKTVVNIYNNHGGNQVVLSGPQGTGVTLDRADLAQMADAHTQWEVEGATLKRRSRIAAPDRAREWFFDGGQPENAVHATNAISAITPVVAVSSTWSETEVTLVGQFRLENIDEYYFQGEFGSYRIAPGQSDFALGVEMEVEGVLRQGSEPLLTVHSIRRSDATERTYFGSFEPTPDTDSPPRSYRDFLRTVRADAPGPIPVPFVTTMSGPRRPVQWIGQFEERQTGGFIFRREGDTRTFEVVGVDPIVEIPTNIRLFVAGSISAEKANLREFQPTTVQRISDD